MGEFQCPVPGCEHERFQTLTALKKPFEKQAPGFGTKSGNKRGPHC